MEKFKIDCFVATKKQRENEVRSKHKKNERPIATKFEVRLVSAIRYKLHIGSSDTTHHLECVHWCEWCRCRLLHTALSISFSLSRTHAQRIRAMLTNAPTTGEDKERASKKRANRKCVRAITSKRRIFLVRHTLINGDYDRTKMTLLWMRGQFPCMNAGQCAQIVVVHVYVICEYELRRFSFVVLSIWCECWMSSSSMHGQCRLLAHQYCDGA